MEKVGSGICRWNHLDGEHLHDLKAGQNSVDNWRSQAVSLFSFLTLVYKCQSTEDSSTWLVVRIRSAENGHFSVQQGADN